MDLPLSKNAFSNYFAVDYQNEESFKKTVPVHELNAVLGNDWHSFDFPNSSTRRRIIRDVELHYRLKTISGYNTKNLYR